MPSFFPRHAIELHLEEPPAFRRFSFSLVEMAIVTGILLRIYRSFALTHGANSWWYDGGTFAFGLVLLLGMATAHLANFPVQRWLWRAPLFVAVEVAAEMAMSLLLLWAGREPNGTVRAALADWPAMAAGTLLTRSVAVLVWAALLAMIVGVVRRTLVHEDAD